MNKKSKNALLLVVIIAIIGIAVGYAALSQELVLNGTATVKGSSDWDVHFVTETAKVNLQDKVTNPTISIDDGELTGTFSAEFEPGGYVEYTVQVENDGTIPAMKSGDPTVSITGDTGNYIKCEVTDSSDNTSSLVKDSGVHEYKVVVRCEDMTQLPENAIDATVTVTFNYVQESEPSA